MATTLAWILAMGGIGLGLLGALVPGFPGAVVALLGVAAFAALTDWQVVTPDALLLATLIAALGGVAQVLAPVWGVRAVSSASGAATGAAVGAVVGLVAPLPLVGVLLGVVFAVLGAWLGRARIVSRLGAVLGVVTAVVVAVTVDLLAVLGVAAVLAAADFISRAG